MLKKLIVLAGFFFGFTVMGIPQSFSQVQTCDSLTCTSSDVCQNQCGDCWTCDVGGTNTCVPNDSYCEGFSGGTTDNICRNATCLPDAVPDDVFINPSGCDYSIDDTATADQCILCEAPRPSDQPTCGDGACEPELGETCANCTLDCLVPGFDLACPRDNTGQNCQEDTITFPGPPWGGLPNPTGRCEDGDLCTDNPCSGVAAPTCQPAVAKACNPLVSDLCCPADCNPPVDGFCSPNDLNCDLDCIPPQYCPFCGNDIVDPGEQCDGTATNGQCDPALCNNATCTCNVSNHCLEGSGFNNNSLNPDCTGWSGCSLSSLPSGGFGNLIFFLGLLSIGFCFHRGLKQDR